MAKSDPTDPHASAGVATNVVEAAVALGVVLLGATVLFGSRKLGSGWMSDGPGPGYFPFYIGWILCISGAGIFVQALFSKKRDTSPFVEREQLKRIMSVLLPALVYVGAIMVLGLYVASAIYITVFMVWLGHYSWVKSSLIAVVTMVIFYGMFEVWFKVPLYKGALHPLGWVGL